MKAARFLSSSLLALPGMALAVAALAGASTASLSLPGGWQGRLAALVPQPGQVAQLMEQRSSITLVELQRRVTRVGGSPDVLRDVIAHAARGEKPEYDERLGLTREEFERYLVFQPVLVPTGKSVKLPVVREGNRLRFGDAPGLNGVLRGLLLDLGTGELKTPEGFGTRPRSVVPSTAPDRTLDIRSGFEWAVRGNNPVTQNGINGQLQLLQLGNGQVILSYRRFSMLRGTTSDLGVILSYTR